MAAVCSKLTRLGRVNRGKNKDPGTGKKKHKLLACWRLESLFYWPEELASAQRSWASTGKGWEEVALPPAEGPALRLRSCGLVPSQLCPLASPFPPLGSFPHALTMGTTVLISLVKSSALYWSAIYKFISFPSQEIIFFANTIKRNQNKPQQQNLSVLSNSTGLSGRHQELMGKGLDRKSGSEKICLLLLDNKQWASAFPCPPEMKVCHSRKSTFLLQRILGWHF